jgi:hypothetical protein
VEGGKLIIILEIAAGPDGSTTELKLGTWELSKYNAGWVNQMGVGTLN